MKASKFSDAQKAFILKQATMALRWLRSAARPRSASHVSMRQALTNLFESVGLQVEDFGSAAEILQAKPPETPSCLVLDIRLPGLSGLELQSDLAKANIHTPVCAFRGIVSTDFSAS